MHIEMQCVGYLYVMDLINAREMEHIRAPQVIAQGLERGQAVAGDTGKW
jgi:hypothetical protein